MSKNQTGLVNNVVLAIQETIDIIKSALSNESMIFNDENIDSMDDKFFKEIKLSKEDIKYLIDTSTLELKQRYWKFRNAAEIAGNMSAITKVHAFIDFYWACLKSGRMLSDNEYTNGYLDTAVRRIPIDVTANILSDNAWTQESYIVTDGDAWLVLAGLIDLGSQQDDVPKRPEAPWEPDVYIEEVSEIFFGGRHQKNFRTLKEQIKVLESVSTNFFNKSLRESAAFSSYKSLRISELNHLVDYFRISELLSISGPKSIRLEFMQDLLLEIKKSNRITVYSSLLNYIHDGEVAKAYWKMHDIFDGIVIAVYSDNHGIADAIKLEDTYPLMPELLKKIWTADQMARACGRNLPVMKWEKQILEEAGISTVLDEDQMKDYLNKHIAL